MEGFIAGRYELTANGVKPGAPLTNDTGVNWYQYYARIKQLGANNKVKTRMICGNQWDVTCNWLAGSGYSITDSSLWGNYYNSTVTGNDGSTLKAANTSTKLNTGITNYTKANNIYDLAGNCFEWTQEANVTDFRVGRGGDCVYSGSDIPVSYCRSDSPAYSDYNDLGTRVTLYVAGQGAV